MSKWWFFIISLFIISFFIRVISISSYPPGLFDDEASQGYDAYSLLKTGKDQYGQPFPILLRSFDTYGSPLYAYLSTFPIALFGLNFFSIRVVSLISGVFVTLLTYVFIRRLYPSRSSVLAWLSGLVIALSPWSIFFSRSTFEANLALLLFVGGLCLLQKTNRIHALFAGVFFALSVYAYQSFLLTFVIFISGYLVLFPRRFYILKTQLFITLSVFFLILIPLLSLLPSAAGKSRLSAVNYASTILSHAYSPIPLFNLVISVYRVIQEFTSQYFAYFSPQNLFYLPNPDPHRSVPFLSVFYPWLLIPFVLGLKFIFSSLQKPTKIILLLVTAAPVSAALTKDPFATFRALLLWWALSLIVGFGLWQIFICLQTRLLRIGLLTFFTLISLAHLYSSYFILLPSLRSADWGYPFKQLVHFTNSQPKSKFLVDTSRNRSSYIFFLFYGLYDPTTFQSQFVSASSKYYTHTDFTGNYTLNNVTLRPLSLGEDIYVSQILVGDSLSISPSQAREHFLQPVFTVTDLVGKVIFPGYRTHPDLKCNSLPPSQKPALCS